MLLILTILSCSEFRGRAAKIDGAKGLKIIKTLSSQHIEFLEKITQIAKQLAKQFIDYNQDQQSYEEVREVFLKEKISELSLIDVYNGYMVSIEDMMAKCSDKDLLDSLTKESESKMAALLYTYFGFLTKIKMIFNILDLDFRKIRSHRLDIYKKLMKLALKERKFEEIGSSIIGSLINILIIENTEADLEFLKNALEQDLNMILPSKDDNKGSLLEEVKALKESTLLDLDAHFSEHKESLKDRNEYLRRQFWTLDRLKNIFVTIGNKSEVFVHLD